MWSCCQNNDIIGNDPNRYKACGISILAHEVGLLCLTSHLQRGHLETAPPFTVPCKGREARFLHRSHRESNPGPSRGCPLHYRFATPAPRT